MPERFAQNKHYDHDCSRPHQRTNQAVNECQASILLSFVWGLPLPLRRQTSGDGDSHRTRQWGTDGKAVHRPKQPASQVKW